MDDKKNHLYHLAIKKLSFRNQSVGEMRYYLSRKSESEAEINDIISRLEETNLLDDSIFTEEWINFRINKGKGDRLIKQELRMKKVENWMIEEKLSEIEFSKWFESAKNVLSKKRFKFDNLNSYQKDQKMKGYLYSRGFSSRVINEVIDDLG